MADVMKALRDAGVEPSRNAVIDAMWGADEPTPWTLEHELQLPVEVQDFSWLDKKVEARPHPGAVADEDDSPDLPERAPPE